MKKRFIIGSLLVASFLYAQATPQIEITQEDVKIQNEMNIPIENKENKNKTAQDYFDEYESNQGITYGETKNGRTFYTGNSVVIDDPKNFAKAVNLAYRRAMQSIQSNFIKDAFGRIANQKISNFYDDSSSNNKEFEELPKGGALSQIMDKVTQLAGAKLDKALQELGVNVQGLTEERKKEIFRDEFISKTIISAFGSMSGLVPVQTFVTKTSDGEDYQVGVIAVVSDKTRMFADDIQKNRTPSIKGKGSPIKEFLPKDTQGYINEYGIRMVYDENGEPLIISYGNWGYNKTSNDSNIVNRIKLNAQESAISEADVAIREFVNTQVSLRDERQTGDSIKKTIKQTIKTSDGSEQITEDVIKDIIDKTIKKVTTSTKGNLRGIRTIKRWSYTDKNGNNYVGAVRVYSYANYVNTTNAVSPIKSKQDTNTEVIKKPSSVEDRKSRIVNTLDDF
ncbi:DUF6844 domain-containing protein [Campylobacter sp.]|uniref:DUF6844 domain-containing protein n=1 Tax=Campylobacter sp. TaxID=205 RepID=UPI0025C66E73|nr:hypothetical protein [Campylobacter sp.]